MVFSSLPFLFLFLPLCLGVYFLVPTAYKNAALLFFSLLFYGIGEPICLLLMVLTVLADYAFGLQIGRHRNTPKKAKAYLIAAVIFNLFLLFFFKYLDLVFELLSLLPPLSHLQPPGIPLPVGISFYTFQALSYVIDVYRREVNPQKNLVAFGTYVTLFPQLIAGPILRYREVDLQLTSRTHSVTQAADGTRRFLVGLAKKLLLANAAGELWLLWRGDLQGGLNLCGAWLGLLSFSLQIYYDFSAYSDMAIGLGQLFGFSFSENFRYPYVSRSITEFWRRWHITLSTWFREYLYFPLGGSRRGKWRTYGNLLAVWLFTGLWHGASLNFLIWGLYFFLLLCAEKSFPGKWMDRVPSPIRIATTLILVMIGWLIFLCDGSENGLTPSQGITYLGALLGWGSTPLYDNNVSYHFLRNLPLLCLMALGATPLPHLLHQRLKKRFPVAVEGACNLLCFPLFALCLAYLVNSGYNPFLYFRF